MDHDLPFPVRPLRSLVRAAEPRIIVDIWTGEHSETHAARYIRSVADAWTIAKQELAAGNLVNLRQDAAWGDYADFDERTQPRPS